MYAFPSLWDSFQRELIRPLLYHWNKEAQLLMHFVRGQRITPMIKTVGPFIPVIKWEVNVYVRSGHDTYYR